MRILHTGDWHLGKNLEGQSRMDEQEEFLKDFINIVEENNIDLVIIAGDVYDTSNPPARAEKMFYDTLKKVSKNGERLTLVVAGNHDNPERLVAAGPLAMEHGIIMVGTPKTVVMPGSYGKHEIVKSGEGFIEIKVNRKNKEYVGSMDDKKDENAYKNIIESENAVILTVPYPSEKRLNEVLYGDMDSDEDRLKSYSERIFTLFDSLKDNYREDTINLVVSHLYTMGSEEGGSERSIQLGGSYIVDGACFPKEAQYIALGHVHKPQVVPGTNKRGQYSGSPLQYNKKEITFEKKCFIVDVKAGEECIKEEVKFKIYKPIEIWKCNGIEDALDKCEVNKDKNCWVYLEIETDRYIREDEIKAMKDIKKDILEIIPKLTGENAISDDLTSLAEKSFKDIFTDFYQKERGVEADNEVVELLLSIMSEDGDKDETN